MFAAWHRQLIGVMMGTNVGEVTQFRYVPPPHEALSFQNKCRWMFTVFDATVKTTSGRIILDRNRDQCNGRRVLYELCDHYRGSTSAQLRLQQIMDQLVTTPLTSSWNKPLEDYISWFIRLVNQYNDTVIQPDQRLSRGMICTMLERNVLHCKPLAAVRTQELFNIAKGVAPLDLEQYVELLRSAASLVDTQQASSRRGSSRRANVHDAAAPSDTPSSNEDPSDDIAELDAYMMQRNPAASMDRNTWQSLAKATHTAWDQISPEDKAKILSYAEERAARRSSNATDSRPRRSVNFTDANSDDTVPDTPDDEDTTLEAHKTETDAQKANAAKASAHPGDMRRFLGTPGKAPPPTRAAKQASTATRSANTVRWTASSASITPETPSGERGGDDSISPSDSPPPLNESEHWGNPPAPTPTEPEMDLWGVPDVDGNPSTPYKPPHDDPFGLESIWEEDEHHHFR